MPSPRDEKKRLEWLKNLSESHKGFKQKPESIAKMAAHHKGAKSHFWKGGIDTKEHRNWTKNKRNRVIKRLKVAGSIHTYGEWELLKAQYGFTCPYCKQKEPEIKLTEDHVIPLSKGGSDLIENIQPLCLSCNMKKHTTVIRY